MKCSAKCKYYQAFFLSGKCQVICDIRGYDIKYIKEKFPEVYKDCKKYREEKK